ncbi:hypothetical protein EB796_003272 [Bugula neritina]|uniref:Uncharacterized protein n=1 Tax=Bugula neritina TaxID=10212 RepID=A0A7J7KLH5_BUGNE|nr:hypothetical protein EB796_003272 [Bugula neritina]
MEHLSFSDSICDFILTAGSTIKRLYDQPTLSSKTESYWKRHRLNAFYELAVLHVLSVASDVDHEKLKGQGHESYMSHTSNHSELKFKTYVLN